MNAGSTRYGGRVTPWGTTPRSSTTSSAVETPPPSGTFQEHQIDPASPSGASSIDSVSDANVIAPRASGRLNDRRTRKRSDTRPCRILGYRRSSACSRLTRRNTWSLRCWTIPKGMLRRMASRREAGSRRRSSAACAPTSHLSIAPPRSQPSSIRRRKAGSA